uniref:ATP/GTP-binding protein n=1 Tax=Vulcanisaeta sp. JCM 14467 TaxID=1295370 RepID=UPI0020922B1D|nr:ATP/GTP-binding protein [Vulcanisaeta sp. JCM 14467]
MPQVNVLNKVDLLDRSVVDQILEWGEETDLLREALMSSQANKLEADLSVRLSDVLTAIGTIPRPIPISAKTGEGLMRFTGCCIIYTWVVAITITWSKPHQCS